MGISCGQHAQTFFIPDCPQLMHHGLPGFEAGYDRIIPMIDIGICELLTCFRVLNYSNSHFK